MNPSLGLRGIIPQPAQTGAYDPSQLTFSNGQVLFNGTPLKATDEIVNIKTNPNPLIKQWEGIVGQNNPTRQLGYMNDLSFLGDQYKGTVNPLALSEEDRYKQFTSKYRDALYGMQYREKNFNPFLQGGMAAIGEDAPKFDLANWGGQDYNVWKDNGREKIAQQGATLAQSILKQLFPHKTQDEIDRAAYQTLKEQNEGYYWRTNPVDIARSVAVKLGGYNSSLDAKLDQARNSYHKWSGQAKENIHKAESNSSFLGDVFGGIFDFVDPILDKLDPFHDKIVQGTAEKLTGMDQRDIFKAVAPIVAGSFLTGPLAGTNAFQSAGAGLSGMTGGAFSAGTGANILAGAATGAGQSALSGGDMRNILGGALSGGVGGFASGLEGGSRFVGPTQNQFFNASNLTNAGGKLVGSLVGGQDFKTAGTNSLAGLLGSGVTNTTKGFLNQSGVNPLLSSAGGQFAGNVTSGLVKGKSPYEALAGSAIGTASGLAGSLIGGQFGNLAGSLAKGFTSSSLGNLAAASQRKSQVEQMKAAYARMTPQQQAALRAKYGRG